jgi:PPOX class probable F420-dependent enzyme
MEVTNVETIPATHADLIEKSQILIMATNGADGYPQVTAMWFLQEDDAVRVSLNNTRQKTKNVLNDRKVSLFFIDPVNPYRTLEIRAIASTEPDPDYAFADKVGAKYGANLRDMDRPGESRVVVSFEPVKVNTFG